MRKLILISALLLTSVSAQAGETRSLSLAGIPTVTTTAAATGTVSAEAPKDLSTPIAQVSIRLAEAATTASDAAPVQAPVHAQAPAAAPATTTATTSETKSATSTESKPKTARKARRESDEAKARRIAARYGVYW
jgi:hypothetical protein